MAWSKLHSADSSSFRFQCNKSLNFPFYFFFHRNCRKKGSGSGHLAHSSKQRQNQLYLKLFLSSDFIASFLTYVMVKILPLPWNYLCHFLSTSSQKVLFSKNVFFYFFQFKPFVPCSSFPICRGVCSFFLPQNLQVVFFACQHSL